MNTRIFQETTEEYLDAHHPGVFNMHRMGENLWSTLCTMAEKGGWRDGSGWIWSNRSTQIKMCQSLVKRGFVTVDETNPQHPRFTTDPIIIGIYQNKERELARERAAARRPQEIANALASQHTKAHHYAVDLLIWFHQVEYDELMQQYKDEHPVEANA
jgi:hypothetical protein